MTSIHDHNKELNKPFYDGNGGLIHVSEYIYIKWMVKGFIPEKGLTMLAGKQGSGKSTFCAWLASILTTGRCWPNDNKPISLSRVGWLTIEEDVEQEVTARLMVNGYNSSNIHFINPMVSIKKKSGKSEDQGDSTQKELLNLSSVNGINYLKQMIESYGIKVMIIDTAASFMGDADQNSNGAVRNYLLQLQQLAKDTNCCIFLLAHINKNTDSGYLDAIQGAGAWTQVPRQILGLIKDGSTHHVGVIKANNSPTDMVLSYECEYVSIANDDENAFGKLIFGDRPHSETMEQIWARTTKSQVAKKSKVSIEDLQYVIYEQAKLIISGTSAENNRFSKEQVKLKALSWAGKKGIEIGNNKFDETYKAMTDDGYFKRFKENRKSWYAMTEKNYDIE